MNAFPFVLRMFFEAVILFLCRPKANSLIKIKNSNALVQSKYSLYLQLIHTWSYGIHRACDL